MVNFLQLTFWFWFPCKIIISVQLYADIPKMCVCFLCVCVLIFYSE